MEYWPCSLNEYEARSAIIIFVGIEIIIIIIRKEHELRQQGHVIFISRRVSAKKTSYLYSAPKYAAYISKPASIGVN
jgi:hypothetical protein